jgi:hypothetical protein
VADLAKSILGATQPTPPSGTAAAGRILENLSPNQAQLILGGLAAYQPSKVQIGRELMVDVTPRSLNGASSAEISVTLKAGETAAPNTYTGGQNSAAADLSRVATHNTSTRVRVDSVQLFDVSSFTAVLQRPRARFPLLPPFVELPYIGTIVGWPLPPATEYHSSTALLSALIVPTAADLAAGLTFRKDKVVTPPEDGGSCLWPGETPPKDASIPACSLHTAISLDDLDHQPVFEYHRAMIHCLATNGRAPGFLSDGTPNRDPSCNNLRFDNFVRSE